MNQAGEGNHVRMLFTRRAAAAVALLFIVLLSVAAAVSAQAPTGVPLALTQTIAAIRAPMVATTTVSATIPESGLLAVVGTALLGIAALVRRSGL